MNSQSNGHGKPPTTIIVNTRSVEWDDATISYEQLYVIAYPSQPLTDNESVRIEYSRGANGHGGGALQPGQSVKVKKGMVFDVYPTVRS